MVPWNIVFHQDDYKLVLCTWSHIVSILINTYAMFGSLEGEESREEENRGE